MEAKKKEVSLKNVSQIARFILELAEKKLQGGGTGDSTGGTCGCGWSVDEDSSVVEFVSSTGGKLTVSPGEDSALIKWEVGEKSGSIIWDNENFAFVRGNSTDDEFNGIELFLTQANYREMIGEASENMGGLMSAETYQKLTGLTTPVISFKLTLNSNYSGATISISSEESAKLMSLCEMRDPDLTNIVFDIQNTDTPNLHYKVRPLDVGTTDGTTTTYFYLRIPFQMTQNFIHFILEVGNGIKITSVFALPLTGLTLNSTNSVRALVGNSWAEIRPADKLFVVQDKATATSLALKSLEADKLILTGADDEMIEEIRAILGEDIFNELAAASVQTMELHPELSIEEKIELAKKAYDERKTARLLEAQAIEAEEVGGGNTKDVEPKNGEKI